jgi:hypothetical protein
VILNRSDVGGHNSHFLYGSTGDWYIRSSLSTGKIVLQDTGGSIGIGSSTFSGVKLYISGDSTSASGTVILNRSDLGGHNSHLLYGPTGDWYVRSSASNGKVVLQDTGGNVGIGTGVPLQKLDVAGTIRQTGCTTTTTLSATIDGDIICTASDARLKNIKGPYVGGLRELGRLSPMRFDYKPLEGSAASDFEHAGFIAQNVKTAIPQAVSLQRNGYYALDTTAILAASVSAIKELKAANESLAADNVQHRAQLTNQTKQIGFLKAELEIQKAQIARLYRAASLHEARPKN